MRTTWTFHAPGELLFGRNAVDQLGEIVGRLGANRVLFITDTALVNVGVVDCLRVSLAGADVDVHVFDGGGPEPTVQTVENAVEVARDVDPDLLLGLGGGSNMDIAKAAAILLAHAGALKDYAGDQVVPGPVFPLILVPTTAGTGSEVSAAAVLADTDTNLKFGVLSNHLRPQLALVDPMLTVSCPPQVTANSGIDALTHAIEAYTAIDNEHFVLPEGERTVYQGRHPISDALAEQAIELIGRYLRRAVDDGHDMEAREGMSLAATTAGLAFSNTGVAVVHALEFALGQVAHMPHGAGCGLLLPYVMQFNVTARQARTARIAELLGEDVSGLEPEAAAGQAIEVVARLKADIGIPQRMSDVGVRDEHLPAMAETAFAVKRILRINPRPVSQQDLQDILQAAL